MSDYHIILYRNIVLLWREPTYDWTDCKIIYIWEKLQLHSSNKSNQQWGEFNSEKHNIRPAGQMWPAKHKMSCSQSDWLKKTPLEWVKSYQLWPLNMPKKNWPAMRFELCTPDLTQHRKCKRPATPLPR